ncbi:hypothetical protein F7725_013420 [Dissostichus mawsoni]|uniref:Uncharacterized protein n=1 Tax=Dissostichus mawsoni TaxID=36200 RepID=A0A7J5YU31_DISMA|nr:hypothetical protein F7725_013420 [Dissostichus mawsoni]
MNWLSADCRTQQRGATLSQLSDSGQTLSEDSGVDIAEAGGLSKDGSPRPSKNPQGHLEKPGAHAPPPGTRQYDFVNGCVNAGAFKKVQICNEDPALKNNTRVIT